MTLRWPDDSLGWTISAGIHLILLLALALVVTEELRPFSSEPGLLMIQCADRRDLFHVVDLESRSRDRKVYGSITPADEADPLPDTWRRFRSLPILSASMYLEEAKCPEFCPPYYHVCRRRTCCCVDRRWHFLRDQGSFSTTQRPVVLGGKLLIPRGIE